MVPRDPFYRRAIEILSHHPDPFWGEPTSGVDWCEANYLHSRYVAEFFNTLSSIPMLIVSVWGMWLCFKYELEARFYLCWLGIGVVGVGSVAFHGTLHPAGQAIDELGMISASLAFLYVVLEIGHVESRRPWLPYLELAYALAFAAAYFTSPFIFPFFVALYAATVLLIIHQAYRIYSMYLDDTLEARWQRVLFWCAAIGYPAGFLFLWVPENALCPMYPKLFQRLHLHAVFHLAARQQLGVPSHASM